MLPSLWANYAAASCQAILSAFDHEDTIVQLGDAMAKTIGEGGTVFFAGNGGSAADAQHLAAELVGRFKEDRPAFAALSLAADIAAMTAIGNDYGFDHIFARQLAANGRRGDLLLVMSTSGRSPSIVEVLRLAKSRDITTAALVGTDSSAVASLSDFLVTVNSREASHIQEAHKAVGHALCAYVENCLCAT